jgi:hypothetical protein
MKFLKALATTACALALATAAHADQYTDSSANYPDTEEGQTTWVTGSNGGEGFGPWNIQYSFGGDGWAGCGIWNPSANEFKGAWEGKERAFGMIGKGAGFSVKASRQFRATLAVDDSFQLDMGVNWDANIDNAHKGFVLTAGGVDVLEINHGNYPGHIYVNGDDTAEVWNEAPKPEEGEILCPMTWKFTAKDATTLTVSANSRKDGSKTFEKDFTVSTSAIDGFRLQSVEQDNQNEDRRQSYYDNFVLDVAAPLPDLVSLSLSPKGENQWAVTRASQTLSFTLERSSNSGSLTAAIVSSDPSFVHPATVVFEDGETSVDFSLDATLTGNANFSAVSVVGTGCEFSGSPFEIKGPEYTHDISGDDDPWILWGDETATFKVTNNRADWFPGDDSLVTVACDPDGIVAVSGPTAWENAEASWTIAGAASGFASAKVLYDGVKMGDDYGFNVRIPGLELFGPSTAKTGIPCTFTLKGTLDGEEGGCTVAIDPEDPGAVIDPASPFTLDGLKEDGFYYKDITVTFSQPGPVTLSVSSLNYPAASLKVVVSEPVDPSKFDDYVAYDDASLYGDGFDFDATGAGAEGFQAWSVFKDSAEYGDAIVTTADGGFPAILTDGKAFAIYANGNDPDYAIYRPFVNDLQPGQKASIEFVVPENPGSSLYVQFARVWDGWPYSRFEFWANGSGYGVNVDGTEGTALGWAVKPRRVVASIQRAANGSEYTLNLEGYDEGAEFVSDIYQHVVKADVGSWGEGIQGIAIGGYNLAADCIFNKLAIEQVEEPVVERKIGWGAGVYNPEGDGSYEITLTATTEDIGSVAISVEPAEWNVGTLVLDSESIDLTGTTSGTIGYTLTDVAVGDSFKISAVPTDATVAALEGEGAYGVTVIESYLSLWAKDGRYQFSTDDDEIWIRLTASPSKYGTYTLVTSDESVLELSAPTVTINESTKDLEAWFNVFIKGAGNATISLAEDESVNWGFEISQGTDVEIPAPTAIKGQGLAWDASILDNGFVLRGTDTLGESPDKDSWTDLVEGTDYVVEEGQVVVLYTSAYNYIALLKK